MLRPCFVATHRGDEGASALYRVLLPVLLAQQLGRIKTLIPDKMLFFPKEMLDIIRPDTVLFHRSHTTHQLRYINDLMHDLDALKIYTIDDWVSKVPKESPHYKDIPHGIDKDIRKAISRCDRLIVTNNLLASVYGYKKETYVIPNYLSYLMWEPLYNLPKYKPDFDAKPRIGWSGGIGHPGDLKILHEIADILGDKVQWVFFGDIPTGFDQGNSEVHNPVPVQQYSHILHSLHLDLALAPLLNNDFNRAKSNLRILEYSACGYPTIASNVGPYKDSPATLLDYNPKWWAEAILKKIEDREALYAEGQAMKDWLWENYKLEDHIGEYTDVFAPDRHGFTPSRVDGTDVVDILITTHNKKDIVEKCINSVLKSLDQNETKVEIIVSDNASTETGFKEYLQQLKSQDITVRERITDDGYVVNINECCMINPDHDVITLNSDTIVNGNWIDRLRKTAYLEENIASVTPLSNNASIMNYPNLQGSGTQPALVKFYDSITSTLESTANLLLPSSVGFAAYIKRRALADLGLFDEHAFRRGYGEENDWSMRGHIRGWRHVADQTVYVGHEHGASFGPEKQKLMEQSARVLAVRWQQYPQLVKQWLEADILKTTRERLDIESIAKLSIEPRTLYIGHGYGGGLETYLQTQLKENPNSIVLRNNPNQPGIVTMEIPNEKYFFLPVINTKLHPLVNLRDIFKKFNIQHISVQTTFGYDVNFPIWIENLAKLLEIDYSIMLHDYLTVCPRLRLVQNVTYCGEPDVSDCNKCVMNYGSAFGQVEMKDYRKMYHHFLRGASKVQAPSKDVSERLLGYFNDVSIEVSPHEKDIVIGSWKGSMPYKEGDVLKIAVIGSLSPDKGSLLVRDCAKYCEDNKLPIQFLVFGNLLDNTSGFKLIEQTNYLRIFNAYEEQNLQSMLELNKCHLFFQPALWPETYSYVLSHAFKAGLWPICFDIGAQAERIKAINFGTVLPYEKYDDVFYLINSFQSIVRQLQNNE